MYPGGNLLKPSPHTRLGRSLLLAVLLCAGLSPAQSDLRPLTILHTNDLHSRFLPDARGEGGFAYLASALRRELQGCRSCLVLDAGDLAQGTPVSTIYRGLPVFQVLNLFRPDVSTLGNHEFDYGWQRTHDFIRAARFPIVSANVADGEGRLMTRRPYLLRRVNGIRVAVIGALTTALPQLTTPELRGPWRALPVVETVRRYAREIGDRADLIVVLAHLTGAEEDQLLRDAPEVALVVAGHLHAGLEQPKALDNRLVVRVRAYGVEFGRLDLQVDRAANQIASWDWKRIAVKSSEIPPARDVARAVGRWEDQVSKIVDVPIGESKRDFSVRELKPLMERAMAESMGADLAFMNLGGIRDVLPQGQLLARHVWNIMPFDNKLVAGRFQGRDLPPRVTEGRSIDPEREYTLVVSDFVAVNQESELGSAGLAFPRVGPLHRDQLIEWIRKTRVLE